MYVRGHIARVCKKRRMNTLTVEEELLKNLRAVYGCIG